MYKKIRILIVFILSITLFLGLYSTSYRNIYELRLYSKPTLQKLDLTEVMILSCEGSLIYGGTLTIIAEDRHNRTFQLRCYKHRGEVMIKDIKKSDLLFLDN